MNGNINRSQAQQSLHYFLFDPNIYTSVILTLKRKSDNLSVEKIKNAVEKAYTQNETTMSAEYDSFKVQDVKCLAASMATTRDILAVCTFENKMNLCFSKIKKVS